MFIFPISKRVMNKLMEGEGADGGTAVLPPPVSKRIKLCEGLDGYDVPIETAYVKQGKKVWVAWDDQQGKATSLQESLDDGMQLVESIEALELLEDASGSSYVKDGLWIVEGPSQRSGVKNANKRTYGRKIWERIIADPNSPQQKAIKNRAMIGHLEHPKDGRTDGNLGALLVIESTLREDGVVWNKYELLDTPAGKIVQEYTKKKVRWGVSSRGNGTVDDDGNVNESDFVLETWDAVMRPSTPGAFPELVGATAKGKKKGVNEDAKIPAGDEPAGGMTEEAKACLQRVGLQVETKTAELSRADSATLMVSLIESAANLTGYAANGGEPAKQARALATRLELVMKAVAANLQKTAEQSVTEAIDAASGVTDKRGEAFTRVIEGLRGRISEVVSESTKTQARVEELEASLAEAERKLAETDKSLSITKRKLDVATSALSEASSRSVKAGVAEAVDEMVESFPALAGYRSELMESESSLDVVARAAGLLSHQGSVPTTVTAPSLSEALEVSSRSALPQGLVESGPSKVYRVDESAPMPAGAVMAASIMSRMPATR